MRAIDWFLIGIFAIGVNACAVDFSLVEGSQVVCATDAECPTGSSCDPNIGLCVSNTGDDAVLPQIDTSSVIILPDRAAVGTAVLVTFDVDEDLGTEPSLALVDPSGAAAPIFDPNITPIRSDRRSYIFSYRPTGTEREITWSLVATVIDRAGNVNPNAVLGTVTLDFSPPALAGGLTLSASRISAGAETTFTFATNEALAQIPQAFLTWSDGSVRLLTDGLHQALQQTYEFAYRSLGDEPGTQPSLVLQLVDTAGNAITREVVPDLVFDFVAPTVSSLSAVSVSAPAGSIATEASHVTYGSSYRVQFTTDEPLVGSPTLRAVGTGTNVGAFYDFVEVFSEGGNVFDYEFSLDPAVSYPQGRYDVVLDMVDEAGNSATTTLNVDIPLVVDTVAPDSPNVDGSDIIHYRRSPWGNDASDGEPVFTLEGRGSAIEGCPSGQLAPCSFIFAFAEQNVSLGNLLGRAGGGTDGSIASFELAAVDTPLLWVVTVDLAGNVSDYDNDPSNGVQAVAVRDVTWTATMTDKQANSTVNNPHTVISTPAFRATLAQDEVRAIEPSLVPEIGDRLGLVDATTVDALSERVWSQRFPTTLKPERRTEHASAYDSVRGRVVVFGGRDSDGELQDIWEWDGTRWDPVFVDGERPAPRAGHAMSFDPARGVSVLFGGTIIDGSLNAETWTWNGVTWANVTPAVSPPARRYHRMEYFPPRGTVLLFGGLAANELNDVWEWDGSTWTELTFGAGPIPSARWFHAMTYDEVEGKLFLYGGRATTPFADMWTFDGLTWVEETFLGPRPSPLFVNRMAYDRSRDRLVLFGEKTWEYDGTQWIDLGSLPGPTARDFSELQYDTVRERVILYGGDDPLGDCVGDAEEICPDIWEWSGSAWAEVTPGDASIPEPRDKHTMIYDSANLRSVVFGGSNGPLHAGTWEWSGANWFDVTPVTEPTVRIRHGMAYDEGVNRGIMFGGIRGSLFCDGELNTCGDTWEWDGAAWTKIAVPPMPPPANYPPPRHSHAMTYSSGAATPGVFLFGGSRGQAAATAMCPDVGGTKDCSDTWIYEHGGAGWTDYSGTGAIEPSARSRHALAWDESRQVVVLFGGLDASNVCPGDVNGSLTVCADTWEWGQWGVPICNSAPDFCWRNVTPIATNSPPSRSSHTMVYDAGRRRVVLYGGQLSTNDETSDAWEWDGTKWVDITPTLLNPPARFAQGMVYDSARKQVIVFGGSARRDTWELSADPDQRPAVLFTVDWRFAAADVADVAQVEITTHALGRGYVTSSVETPVDGAQLLTWNPTQNRWVAVAGNDAGPFDAPELINHLDASSSQSIFTDDDQLHFAVQPEYPLGNGNSPARVSVDYFQVAVTYRRAGL